MAIRQRIQFTFLKEPPANEKLAPQARQILELIKNAPEGKIEKTALLEKMPTVIVTRQGVDRILAFYQGNMEKAGYIAVAKLGPTPEETEAAEKAKADKEAAKAAKAQERAQKRAAKAPKSADADAPEQPSEPAEPAAGEPVSI